MSTLVQDLKDRGWRLAAVSLVFSLGLGHALRLVDLLNYPFPDPLLNPFFAPILKSMLVSFPGFFLLATLVIAIPIVRKRNCESLALGFVAVLLGGTITLVAAYQGISEMLILASPELQAGALQYSGAIVIYFAFVLTCGLTLRFSGIERASLELTRGAAILMSVVCLGTLFYAFNLGSPQMLEYSNALKGMFLFLGLVCSVISILLYRAGVAQIRRRCTVLSIPLFILVIVDSSAYAINLGKVPESGRGSRKPPVILLTVDALRGDSLSCIRGSGKPETPGMDALAADGILYRNAMSVSPWTQPSISTMLTGEDPRVHLFNASERMLWDAFETLTEKFSSQGRLTTAILHNFCMTEPYNFSQGFWSYRYVDDKINRYETNPVLEWASKWPGSYYRLDVTQRITCETTRLLRFLKNRDFFLWIHYFDPHFPYTPPEHWIAEPGVMRSFTSTGKTDQWNTFSPAKGQQDLIRDLYLSEVRYVDAAIELLLDRFKDAGIYDDSLIVLTSDHGEEFWEHGGFEHGHSVHRELHHVPLVFKFPGSAMKGVREAHVSNGRILPTISDFLGWESDSEGSLMAINRGEDPDTNDRPVFGSGIKWWLTQDVSVIHDGWKLIRGPKGKNERLYSLKEDPGEFNNVASGHPERVADLGHMLDEMEEVSEARRNTLGINPEVIALELDPQSIEILRGFGYLE